jgi:hypothetical protein
MFKDVTHWFGSVVLIYITGISIQGLLTHNTYIYYTKEDEDKNNKEEIK